MNQAGDLVSEPVSIFGHRLQQPVCGDQIGRLDLQVRGGDDAVGGFLAEHKSRRVNAAPIAGLDGQMQHQSPVSGIEACGRQPAGEPFMGPATNPVDTGEPNGPCTKPSP